MNLKNKHKNYPYYETVPYVDFRQLTQVAAERYGDRIAFSWRKNPRDEEVQTASYNQVCDRVRRLGTGMIDLGLRDQKAALMGEANCDWASVYFALGASGSVSVPIDRELPPDDIVNIITRANCCAVFYSPSVEEKIGALRERIPGVTKYICMGETSADWASELEALIERGVEKLEQGDTSYDDYEIDPDRLASIVFTSGTTGKGKGVMLSQRNITSDMNMGMLQFTVSDKTMFVLPPHHTYGSTVNLVGHYGLGSQLYFSSGVRYLMQEMKEQQPKHIVLVPLFVETLYKKIWQMAEKSGKAAILRKAMKISGGLMKVGIDMRKQLFKDVLSAFGGQLEMIICGGAALSQDIIDTFEAFGIVILNGYGITECSPLVSCNRNQYRKDGSVGCPLIASEVKIHEPDEDGEGEICVKGTHVMLGYYEDPEATAAVMDEDGYFHTGDWGKLDEEGWIYITGRIKNIIILANGKNVYPEEIEHEISAVPGVAEVVVYAGESKNEEREIIVAEIYPDAEEIEKRGITDVKAYFSEEVKKINARMAPYKAVGHIKLRSEEFMKNTSRKITRFNIDKSID
ncbi:MAG: hypothetical protein E7662_03940 [Ruminococcaceae bacterium]|nr:hypothetical protein [Oscillospiraceae bacterium]